MRDFRHRRGGRAALMRLALRSLGVVALGGITFIVARGAWGMYAKFADASDADTQAQAQLAQLKQQYAQVSAQVSELSSERGQEAELRARYGVALPGEGEIDIVQSPSSSAPAMAPKEPWWQRLWDALHVW